MLPGEVIPGVETSPSKKKNIFRGCAKGEHFVMGKEEGMQLIFWA